MEDHTGLSPIGCYSYHLYTLEGALDIYWKGYKEINTTTPLWLRPEDSGIFCFCRQMGLSPCISTELLTQWNDSCAMVLMPPMYYTMIMRRSCTIEP